MALVRTTPHSFHVLPSTEAHAGVGRAWSPFIGILQMKNKLEKPPACLKTSQLA